MKQLIAIILPTMTIGLWMFGCQDLGNGPRPVVPPATELTAADATTLEGNMLTFRIILGEAHPSDVSASWRLHDGTALSGSDYVADSGTILIPVGALVDSVRIVTVNDATIEPGEEFTIELYDIQNAGFDDSIGTGTIWDEDGARYSSDVMPIVTSTCALSGCHSQGTAEYGLDLGDGSWQVVRYEVGDNGPFVVAGDADQSLFYLAIRPASYPGIDRMPQGGPYLPSSQRQYIIDWINQGAQDN